MFQGPQLFCRSVRLIGFLVKWVRKAAAVVAVVGVVLVGPVPTASAVQPAEPLPTIAITAGLDDFPEHDRINMSSRSRMLTVLGSTLRRYLGVGSPATWNYTMANTGYSEAKLRQMMENSTLNPNPAAPQRVEEYFVQNHPLKDPVTTDPNTGKKHFRLSPTAPAQWVKAGVGAVGALTFVPMIGGMGSDVVGGWMGYSDVQNEWCMAAANANDAGYGFSFSAFGLLSGRDCTGWNAFDESYIVNGDAGVTVFGGAGGYSYLGTAVYYLEYVTVHRHCYAGTSTINKSFQRLEIFVPGSGEWVSENTTPSGHLSSVSNGLTGCRDAGFIGTTGYIEVMLPSQEMRGPLLRVVLIEDDSIIDQMHQEGDDPLRYLECVITLNNGETLTTISQTYRESEGSFNVPACESIPEGMHATNVAVNEHFADGSQPATSVYSEPATDEYLNMATNYPECMDGGCLLDLRLKSDGKLGASCFDIGDQCADWWDDPDKTEKYQCTYGLHDVDIDECAVYAGIFKPERVAVGAPYSDPMTGEWHGEQNAPRLDGQAMSQGIQDPASGRSCTGMNITGFDPVGFVMRPIQCALEWAFVPRPLVVEASLAKGDNAWEGKPPAVIAAAVEGFAVMPTASGCSKTVTIFEGPFATSITPLNACPGSWSEPVAAVSRVVTAAAMVVLVIVVVRRQISGMVGYGQGQ